MRERNKDTTILALRQVVEKQNIGKGKQPF